ncbi:MAG: J domain-containing protein [Candidatus Cryptobacteroides sp.]
MFFIISIITQIIILNLLINAFRRSFRFDSDQRQRRTDWSEWYQWNNDYGNGTFTGSASTVSAAYNTLGITADATDSDIKFAYKQLAKKYHPDRYATASVEIQKSAEEKFKKINEAYMTIRKNRGMKSN